MVAPKTEGNNNLVASKLQVLKITKYPHFCPHNGVILKNEPTFFTGCHMSTLDWKALATLAIFENPFLKPWSLDHEKREMRADGNLRFVAIVLQIGTNQLVVARSQGFTGCGHVFERPNVRMIVLSARKAHE